MGAGAGFGLLAQAPRLMEAAATATIAITLMMFILTSPPFQCVLQQSNLAETWIGTTKIAEKIQILAGCRGLRGPLMRTSVPGSTMS